MSKEMRRVPVCWEHPKENGEFKPLMDDYIGSLKYYKEDIERFIQAMTDVIKKGKVKIYDNEFKTPEEVYDYLTEDELIPPDIKDYMPEGKWYQLYEDVSEGTPVSPAFSTPEELVNWLTNNPDYWGDKWNKESAEWIVKTGSAMSGIFTNGKFYKPEEQYLLDKKY